MKKLLLTTALLLASPAMAQIQFNSVEEAPAVAAPTGRPLPAGIGWLTRQPVTLFDLGLMEITRQASEQLRTISGVGGAVAEYREDFGLVLINFYPATGYRAEVCSQIIQQMRQNIFPQYKDTTQLSAHISSFFSSYGPQAADRPASIGDDLLKITYMVVRLSGGSCDMKLTDEKAVQHIEPGFTPPPMTSENMPQIPEGFTLPPGMTLPPELAPVAQPKAATKSSNSKATEKKKP